jgi:hypothetical protein
MSNLNFDSVLSAINILIKKEIESFPYLSQGTGIIKESLGSGKYTVVYNGAEIEAVDLNQKTEHKENDSVYIKDACCPDKLCEHTGEIHSANQSVVCLPAKVSVTLESGTDIELDAVVG